MGSQSKDRRIFAIGDVHGCAQELDVLLRRLKINKDDLIVFLGDYVDRGEQSRQVIDVILEVATRCEVIALKGNHEAMLLDFLDHPESTGAGLFVLNGGNATLASYSGSAGYEFPEEHLNFLKNLKLFYQTDTHFFVHAGLPDIPLKELNEDKHALAMMWSRQPFLSSNYDWGKIIVHGHTPVQRAEIRSNRINLDTGCVYGGHLTALELPKNKLHHVNKGSSAQPPLFIKDSGPSRRALRFQGRLPVLAGPPGEKQRLYETLNYNQLGLLIRESEGSIGQSLKEGEAVEGQIGKEPQPLIQFKGQVVRTESRGRMMVYGIRIEKLTGAGLEPAWIEKNDSGGASEE